MSLPAPDNLVRIGQIKAEPRNDAEVGRMLALARGRLVDARQTTSRSKAASPAPTTPPIGNGTWLSTRDMEIDESAIAELCDLVAELIEDVTKLVGK